MKLIVQHTVNSLEAVPTTIYRETSAIVASNPITTKQDNAKPVSCRVDQVSDSFINTMAYHFNTTRSNVVRACIRSVRGEENSNVIVERFL